MKSCLKSIIPIALLLSLPGCKTPASASKIKDAADMPAREIPPLVCESGDASYFHMRALPSEPAIDEFKIPPPAQGSDNAAMIPIAEMVARLDICIEGEVPILKRVIFGLLDQPDVVQVVPGSKVEGLPELLFNDDYTALDIIIPYGTYKGRWDDAPKPSNEAVHVKGSNRGGAAIALVLSKEGDAWVQSTERFLKFMTAGKFEFEEGGHPDDGGSSKCPASAQTTGSFTLGTAKFDWRGLAIVGTSGGAAPRLCAITVTDSAPELGTKAGQAVKMEFPLEGDDVYQFSSNHHSVCDSFILKTPDAVYAVTASSDGFGGGTCPPPLRGAPVGARGVTKFSFTYGSKTITGTERCRHHTRSCR